MKIGHFSVLFSFLALLLFSASVSSAEEPYRIALYRDGGVFKKSYNNVVKVLETDPGLQFETVNGQQIRDGILDGFDIVLLPGGMSNDQIKSLQPEGIEQIKKFIRSGKGYVGICAGAAVAVKQDILNAKVKSSIWWRGRGVVKIEFSEEGRKIVGENFQGQYDVLYSNGPIVNVNVDPNKPQCEVLAWFRTEMAKGKSVPGIQINSPAIIQSTCGEGTVVTFSPHLEHPPEFYEPLLKILHHVGKRTREN